MSFFPHNRRAALLLGIASLCVGPIVSAPEDLYPYVIEASEFVAQVTRADVPPVSVRRGHQLELQTAVFGDEPSQRPPQVDIGAAFDPIRSEIVIADEIDLTTPLGLSFLVHELVHSQQYAAGRQTQSTCPGSLEAEAYALQARFLRSSKRPRDALLYEILGLMQASCNEHLR